MVEVEISEKRTKTDDVLIVCNEFPEDGGKVFWTKMEILMLVTEIVMVVTGVVVMEIFSIVG